MIRKILYLLVSEMTLNALIYFGLLLLLYYIGFLKFESLAYMVIGTLGFIFILDITVKLYELVKDNGFVKGD